MKTVVEQIADLAYRQAVLQRHRPIGQAHGDVAGCCGTISWNSSTG